MHKEKLYFRECFLNLEHCRRSGIVESKQIIEHSTSHSPCIVKAGASSLLYASMNKIWAHLKRRLRVEGHVDWSTGNGNGVLRSCVKVGIVVIGVHN